MLSLFKELNTLDHEYLIAYDFLYWPYGDKDFDFVLGRVKLHIDMLVAEWAERVIVAPVYELALAEDKRVMPLFKNYILTHVLAKSLVGKIGLFGDFADIQHAQSLLEKISKNYTLTAAQKNTKKFQKSFAYWLKQVTMRKYYLTTFSYSDFMVNKQIKFDLKYFKDANVDTVVPLNYAYFNFEKTIKNYFNQKKTKFHTLKKLVSSVQEQIQTNYSVKVFYSGHAKLLKAEKRIMRMLERGKEIEVVFEKMM